MTYDEAMRQLALLDLPAGFTGEVIYNDNGMPFVTVYGPNDWVCMFTELSQTPWAQRQINAASQ